MTASIHDGTKIEWTHVPGYRGETWNPVTGCDRISPGCAHCYARTMARRLKAMGQPGYQRDGDGPGFGVSLHPDKLDEPLRWRKPRAVFVNSMSDLFHDEIPDDYIERVWHTMAICRDHLFMVLTKRPERARALLSDWSCGFGRGRCMGCRNLGVDCAIWPLPNVWLGVSIENARFTWRADVLREIPAAVRFISAEPLLGSLFRESEWKSGSRDRWDAERGAGDYDRLIAAAAQRDGWHPSAPLDLTGIDWLIAGGESGPGARPMRLEWVDQLVADCREHNVAPFVKQLGSGWARHVRADHGIPADGKGGDWNHWPERLRIREFPGTST